MFLAIEDNFLLYVKDTAGQPQNKSVDNYDDQQLEKLEKINKVLEDIKILTEQVKDKDVKVEVKSENKESEFVSFGNSLIDSLTKFRESLTNKNINSNISMSGGMANSNSMIKTMQDSVVNNNKNVNDLIKTNRLAYQMQTNFGNKMKDMGHKFMDVITTPIKLYTDIKQNISSAMDFLKSPMEGMSDWLGLGKKDKKELEVAGIVKTTLDINKVKKSSAVGVALVWFNEELKNMLGLKGGLLNKTKEVDGDEFSISDIAEVSIGSMMGGFLTTTLMPMIMTALPFIIAAVLAVGAIGLLFATFKSRLSKAEATGRTPEKLLDLKEGEKASKTDTFIAQSAIGLAGDVGKGTSTERTMNGVKNAAIGGSFGMMLGGAVGLLGGPIGVAAGAAIGGKIGAAVGGLTGIIGDKQLAKGVKFMKDNFIELATPLGAVKLGFKGLESIFPGLMDTLSKLWDKAKKKAGEVWDATKEKLGITDKKNEQNPNQNITDKNYHSTTDNKQRSGGINLDDYKVAPDLATATVKYISGNEGGGAGSVNKNDAGVGASVGPLQWNRGRLKEVLDNMKKADEKTLSANMGEDFMKKYEAHKDWSKKGIVFTEQEKQNWQRMMSEQKKMKPEDAKILNVVNNIAKRDTDKYLKIAQSKGITDPKAQMFYADMINQHGEGGANSLLTRAGEDGSFEALRQARSQRWSGQFDYRANNLEKIFPTVQEQLIKTEQTAKNAVKVKSVEVDKKADLAMIEAEQTQIDKKQQENLFTKSMTELSAKFPDLANKDKKETVKSDEVNRMNNMITSSNENILGIPKAIMDMMFGVKIGGDGNILA